MQSKYGEDENLLTVVEAADHLSCSPSNIRGLMKTGKLEYVRVGCSKGFRIAMSEVQNYIATNTEVSTSPVDRKKPVRFKSRHFNA